jgi:hypothetical protein
MPQHRRRFGEAAGFHHLHKGADAFQTVMTVFHKPARLFFIWKKSFYYLTILNHTTKMYAIHNVETQYKHEPDTKADT